MPFPRDIRDPPEGAEEHDPRHVPAMTEEVHRMKDGLEDPDLRYLPAELGPSLRCDLLLAQAERVYPLDLR